MSKNIQKKVPEIRFSGFDDDWEQRKLGDITNYLKGYAFKSKDYQNKGYRIVRVSDLGKDSIKQSSDSIFVSEQVAKQQDKYLIKANEIIITTVGSKAEMKESAVGRPIIVKESFGFLLNQNLVKIHGKSAFDNHFIYSQLLQPRYTNYVSMIERGNANQANIAINDLWEYQIFIPRFGEQKKIGVFFKQLDDTIALHQRKIEALQQMKKGFLQQLFPEQGENIPKLRFADFKEEWEQRKLGDVFEQTVEYIDPKEAGLDLWSVTVENGLTPKSERYNREFLVKKNDKFKVIHPNEIVYNPMNMTLGSVGFNNSGKDVAISGYYVTMKLKEEFDSNYFATWLPSPKAIGLYKLYATGSLIERQRVQFPTLSAIKTAMPSLEEQKKIGEFFKHLDNTITLHQRKLDQLNKLKTAFLQNMFI